MALTIFTSGLPLTAKDILVEASNAIYGEGVADIVELTKDSLRQKVRLSQRNVSIVLVVLDGVSTDLCKDIENGLYTSDKFYSYTDDTALVKYLNSKYSLQLELPSDTMELSGVSDVVNTDIVERFKAQISDRDSIINSLNNRIIELTNIIEAEGLEESNSEELDKLKKENLDLRSELLDKSSEIKSHEELLADLRKERDELKISVEKLESKQNSTLASLKSATDELTEYKSKYSIQSGVLRSKDTELDLLKEKVLALTESEAKLKLAEEGKKLVEKHISDAQLENTQLKLDVISKDKEINRLKKELEKKDTGISDSEYKAVSDALSVANADKDKLVKELASRESEIKGIQKELQEKENAYNSLILTNDRLQQTADSLEVKLKSCDESLMQLNKEKLEMQSKLNILEKSTDRDADIESLVAEISSTRQKYDKLAKSVFGRIASLAMPKGSTAIQLTKGGVVLPHIRFVFSGNTESRKGTYKSLLDEFRNLPANERILIVDCVSETSVDYVFAIQKVVSGIDWFRKGGGVQPYLSNTCLKNVQVLSPGLGYINDSYFLTIDWKSRLTELENSGYNVVLYCGDISNLVGRILHESFADLGSSMIYVHGNAIGARTIVSNLKGLTNSGKSIVCYFDLNKKMQRFYELVQKTNECRILNVV